MMISVRLSEGFFHEGQFSFLIDILQFFWIDPESIIRSSKIILLRKSELK